MDVAPMRNRTRGGTARTIACALAVAAVSSMMTVAPAAVVGGAAPAPAVGSEGAGTAPPAPRGTAPPAADPRAPRPVDSAALAAALAAADTAAFALELDRLLYEDCVASLPADRRPPRPPCPLDRLRASLPSTTILLAFLPDGDAVWACAVERDAVHARRLDAPHTAALGPRLAAWAADPAGHPYDPRAAFVVHNNLFPPFGALLRGKRQIVVAAGGVLRAVPFDALVFALPDDAPVEALPFLMQRFEVAHEATLGSRLGWSSRPGDLLRFRTDDPSGAPRDRPMPDGTLPAAAAAPGEETAAASLFWLRKGARGALLGGSEGGMDAFLRAYYRERASGRRLDVRNVQRARAELLRAGAPIEAWAWPRLFGTE